MRRNFKLILSFVVVLLAGALAFSQEDNKIEYKDVILDGKPAKLNVATGEITFVNPSDKKKPVKLEDNVAKPEKETKVVVASNPKVDDYYVVKEGETLLEIANRNNTTLTELKRVNNLETTLVSEGQRLRVRNFDVVETEPKVLPIVKTNENHSEFHIVEPGETLYSLAKQYGLTVDKLKQQNGLISNTIKVGQKLNILETDLDQELGHISVWTVSNGDTLYSIAKKNGTTVEQIKSLNGLTSNLIKIGQKLQLGQ
ncbi:LysM peptidoglycan-binding domain-containing protein [Winogradskyella luteola]|uniref:LysM peptidoglycan-binding domain-containing protein n=1 Tax=Winogradskyella luteola TaxID=2828330 RepID=A0A9X1FAP3_9FLAO|nr:LysM peptidoglycan-binding domain-containing protein [Winogradskyella luteola]MBV7270376.1 LysM peptidoglycan-binding domain-containing protein [Winogradskyella luteola]